MSDRLERVVKAVRMIYGKIEHIDEVDLSDGSRYFPGLARMGGYDDTDDGRIDNVMDMLANMLVCIESIEAKIKTFKEQLNGKV